MSAVFDEPVLKFLIDYLWKKMVIPDSDFFLPKMLSEQQNSYDPFHVGEWNMHELPNRVDAACNSGSRLGVCTDNPTLLLDNVLIKGLYNLQPTSDKPKVNNTNLETYLDFCTLEPGKYVTSKYITVTGSYTYTQGCKPLVGGGPDYTVVGKGTFEAQIFQAQGYGNLDVIPDPQHPDQLLVRMNAMALIAPPTTKVAACTAPGGHKDSNICISIKMSSGDDFNWLANQAANYEKVTELMLSNINKRLADPVALKNLSDMLTNKVNHLFTLQQAGQL